jgi:hypothetical protein
MKPIILFSLFCFTAPILFAQQQTYDLVSYNPPTGWKKEVKTNMTVYTMTDKKKNSWCQIFLVKSTTSKGSIEADFESEWREFAVANYKPTETPNISEVQEADGWKIRAGSAKFVFNGHDAIVVVNTFSGYNRCVSIVAATNNRDYMQQYYDLLETIDLVRPSTDTTVTQTTIVPAGDNNFAFNTTNFDDGWTSTVKEDWVEVTKERMSVLLHYPKEGTIFPADPGPLTNAAWDILVAPRYSNLKNYKTASITTYNRPYLGMGYATEKATGKNVFIVLFRQGNTGWLEFVAPDKNSFIQQFKFDPETIQWDSNDDLMISLINMSGYNKFAVAASDLKGKWTSDFTGIQQMYNVYTGQYAGMNINQSNEEFIFSASNSYNWKLLVVNGMVGNAKYTEVKSAGQFTVPNNWQIYFSRIETGPRTFHAFWSCIKGARVLNLLDANAPGSGIYTKFGLAK